MDDKALEGRIVFRRKRLLIGIAVIILIPVLALAWWLGSPLFINKTVEDEFPFAADAAVPANMTRDEVEKVMEVMSKVNAEMDEAMPDEMMKQPSATAVKSGSFRDADSFHKGSGTATIYRGTDGSLLLRLEDFRVTNGPDLHVILTPHPDPRGRDDVMASGYVELGKLKGNIGNQNYAIPEGVDVAAQKSVVIYCKPFHVVFSVAMLQDAA
jgi:hypothetical protein